MLSMAYPRRIKRPSRSYSPVSSISVRSICTWSIFTKRSFCNFSRLNPKEGTFMDSSSGFSSKAINTPGTPNSIAPLIINSIESKVLPQPAAPQTREGLPFGSPPPVISSKPAIPVGVLGNSLGGDNCFFDLGGINKKSNYNYGFKCSAYLYKSRTTVNSFVNLNLWKRKINKPENSGQKCIRIVIN